MFLIFYNSDSYNYRISYPIILQHIEEIKAPFIPRLKPVKLVWAFWRDFGKDKVRFYVTMPKDLKLLLDKLAQEENRSLSNYIVTVLQKYIEGHPK